jgi:hypothetical protein
MSAEYYRLVAGTKGEGVGDHGWEDDLFAGVAESPGVEGTPGGDGAPVVGGNLGDALTTGSS